MNRNGRILLIVLILLLIAAAYFAGSAVQSQAHKAERLQCCRTLISFAIDKAENGDLADPGVRQAMISNVYAAYQFCDDSRAANQLHDLWNYLIFEGEDPAAAAEIALQELSSVLRSLKGGS